jgi:DNA-binding NarL/FixJ family response regulator
MRVAIADDSGLFRAGLALLLDRADIEVQTQAETGTDLLELVGDDPPDVAIVDIRMPPTFTEEGIDTARAIRRLHPTMGVLVLSAHLETAYAQRLFRDGEAAGLGYMLKDRVDDIGQLRDALSRLARGESVVDPLIIERLMERPRLDNPLKDLTGTERAVLRHMAEGRTNAGIAAQLHVSPKTVEKHNSKIFERLGLPPDTDGDRRVLAVLSWLRHTVGG